MQQLAAVLCSGSLQTACWLACWLACLLAACWPTGWLAGWLAGKQGLGHAAVWAGLVSWQGQGQDQEQQGAARLHCF